MIDRTELSMLLFATVQGYAERAVEIVDGCTELDRQLREDLRGAFTSGAPNHDQCRALGDALRAAAADRSLVNECYRAAFYASPDAIELARNPLFAYFVAHRAGPPLHKWPHYFPVYHRHLERFRGRPVRVLEIGVFRGGGLDLWRWYFGPAASIVGIDVDPEAQLATAGRHTVFLGDQEDAGFLRSVEEEFGPFDVIIDDGGHTMSQQISTVETLFPLLAEGGVLIVEDCHTSYWPEYGGGLGTGGSFLDWCGKRVDDLHVWHRPDGDTSTTWATDLAGLHFYDSVVVFDKESRFAPFHEVMGGGSFVLGDQTTELGLVELRVARDAVVRTRDEGIAPSAPAGPPAFQPAVAPTPGARRRPERLIAEIESTTTELAVVQEQLAEAREQLRSMRASSSWRVTAPLRGASRRLRPHG